MDGWVGAAVLALFLSLAPDVARAEERAPVHLCGLSSADDVRAAAGLDDILATATLIPIPGACDGPPETLRAILVDRDPEQVALLLEGPAMALERLVPWISSPADGLAELERKGRLASFAILLEALLAEYRLTAAAMATPPAPPAAVPTREPATEPRRAAPAPKPRVVIRAEPPPKPGSEPDPEPTPAPDPEPEAKPEGPIVRRPIQGKGGATAPGGFVRERSSAPVPVPELSAGIRFRAPDLVGTEYGVGLRIGPVFATARFQPGVDWTAEERPLSVSALGLELGWLHPLPVGDDARVLGRVAVLGERLVLRQRDLEGKVEHHALDVGVEVGVALDHRLIGGLWASAGVEGIWLPTAGALVIEDELKVATDYVRVRFNGVGARATLAISWRQ